MINIRELEHLKLEQLRETGDCSGTFQAEKGAACRVPLQGWLLAYTRTKIYFREYDIKTEVSNENQDDIYKELEKIFSGSEDNKNGTSDESRRTPSYALLELHMFNDDCEYRVVSTDSKRKFEGSVSGTIEHICACKTDETDALDWFCKDVLLENGFAEGFGEKIRVVQHICYDDRGMALIDDYRLRKVPVQEKGGQEA